jgi:hypothetical protein
MIGAAVSAASTLATMWPSAEEEKSIKADLARGSHHGSE